MCSFASLLSQLNHITVRKYIPSFFTHLCGVAEAEEELLKYQEQGSFFVGDPHNDITLCDPDIVQIGHVTYQIDGVPWHEIFIDHGQLRVVIQK